MKKFITTLILMLPVIILILLFIFFGLDGVIYGVLTPILIYCLYAFIRYGIFATPTTQSFNRIGTVKGSSGLSWHSDKTYVPGVGYRDANGQYYASNHVPIVTPVTTKDN